MLTQPEIDAMRSVAEEALPGTAIIQNRTYTDSGGGGATLTWAASGTVACRLAPIRGTELERGDRVAADADWIITLPAETPILYESRVVIGSTTYNVKAVRSRDDWELTRRIEATEET